MDMSQITARLETEIWDTREIAPVEVASSDPSFERYAVMRHENAVQLIPLASRRISAASVVRWTDGMSPLDLGKRGVGWLALLAGLGPVLAGSELAIKTRGAADSPSLNDHLASAVGLERTVVSVLLGSERPNQKPMVRVLDPAGRTIAFAKVGWNDLTTRLVTNEASFLETMRPLAGSRLLIPALLDHSTWRNRAIAVTSPLMGRLRPRRSRPPSPAVYESILALGARHSGPWRSSAFRAHLADGLEVVVERERLASIIGLLDDALDSANISVGRWHGDWTPWNTLTMGDRVIAWDWERTMEGVPIGFDAIHYLFQPRFSAAPSDHIAPLLASVDEADPVLAALGIGRKQRWALAALYAAGLYVRFGMPPHDQFAVAAAGLATNAATALIAPFRHRSG